MGGDWNEAIATKNRTRCFYANNTHLGRIHDVRKIHFIRGEGLHMHQALPRLQLLGISAPKHVAGRLQLRTVSANVR